METDRRQARRVGGPVPAVRRAARLPLKACWTVRRRVLLLQRRRFLPDSETGPLYAIRVGDGMDYVDATTGGWRRVIDPHRQGEHRLKSRLEPRHILVAQLRDGENVVDRSFPCAAVVAA